MTRLLDSDSAYVVIGVFLMMWAVVERVALGRHE